jgi:hypothetical protein
VNYGFDGNQYRMKKRIYYIVCSVIHVSKIIQLEWMHGNGLNIILQDIVQKVYIAGNVQYGRK